MALQYRGDVVKHLARLLALTILTLLTISCAEPLAPSCNVVVMPNELATPTVLDTLFVTVCFSTGPNLTVGE